MVFSDRLDVECERNRGTQEDSKGLNMNKQQDGFVIYQDVEN